MSNHEIQFNQVAKMFEGTNEGLFVMDSDYNVKYYNMNFYNPFSIDSMKNNTCTIDEWIDRIHDMDRSRMRNSYKDFLSGSDGEYFEGVYRVYLKSKEVCWIQSRAMMIHHEDESWSVIGVHKDISKEKHLDHMLYDFNYVDDLTGLLNQSKLEKVLAEIISKSEKYMLIYININEFKFINEAYGEEAGDRVLIRVAETLKHNAKISNMIFRIHGDEFVLLMNNDMSNEEIYGFINLLKEDIQKRFYIKRKLIGIKVSVGVCQLPMELKTPLSVIQRAKWTMNYAKRKTHSMVAMFDEEIDRCILKRMYIQAEMKSAMDNGEFYLKFQPVMDIKQKKIKTFEALIRWNSSGWGEIFPDEFINIAEENGDITELGQFVLEESCKFVKKFKEEYNKDIRVSVNVSVVQLMERQYVSNFLNTIKDVISHHQHFHRAKLIPSHLKYLLYLKVLAIQFQYVL